MSKKPLPLIASFFVALTAVTYQFQGWLAALMSNPRRRRSIIVGMTIGFILLAQSPNDPYFLELEGQILHEAGRPADALASLRRATQLTNNSPLIATLFGHALIATEDPANLAEAERVLKASVARDRDNPTAWYLLGVVYGGKGDMARARLASAEQQALQWNFPAALQSAEAAEATLPEGSADWLRAQDIAFQARAMIERTKKRR